MQIFEIMYIDIASVFQDQTSQDFPQTTYLKKSYL